ncbi:hypothetical protein TARUN_1482 [Trichoderma arundinaceum]|uniref:Uncharacterized protein n=1 Tax=Trichoderma arundinaceum TaxID=490622 RepID=A0A395NXJ0_TRIAR|nr:hypothetical protein TARUN_1482 [Trichoderma arundinaceum]
MAVLSRVLLAAAAAVIGVSAKTVTLNFDDISVSNDEECGLKSLNQKTPYNGFLITGSNVGVLNSTRTKECPQKEETRAYPNWSTSGSNVVYNSDGSLKFKVQGTQKITKSAFDISVIFYDDWLLLNSTIQIQTTLSTGDQEFYVFQTLEDGVGPFHIDVTGPPATWVQIESIAIMPIGEGPTINTDLIVDTAVIELA